ncbi:MAG: hypothetical protein JO087_11105 [Actinobacteria bacterium]|nr:hypothetical protein [Actinomycetota bacterium]
MTSPTAAARWTVPALALVIAALLVTGSTAAIVHEDKGESAGVSASTTTSTSSTTTTAPPPSTVPPTSGIQQLVDQLEAFVATTRGLPFSKPVPVTLLASTAFQQRLAAVNSEGENPADATKAEKVLRALGLLDKGVSLDKAEKGLLGDAVAGFYDPKRKELVVRGADPSSPYVRTVLAHELTHADQDEHFGIDRPAIDKRDDEASQAFSALVEGDAVRIQQAYQSSLPAKDRAKAQQEESAQAGTIDPNVPPVLLDTLSFPYTFGVEFVKAVVRAGGQARLDAAFVNPPTTSEQILHPEKFLAGEGPKTVADPPADGKVIDHGVVGEFGLLLMFLDTKRPLPQSVAARASDGWGGDRYVAWDSGDKTCLRANFVMDTPSDTDQLVSALKDWASRQPAATVSGTNPIVLTTCN